MCYYIYSRKRCDNMEKRRIKDISVSLLGMGCMRLPKKDNDEIDFEATEAMIEYAYNNGITYFDTAYPYHNGQSEIVIGKILKKYPRESFYLADKMPIWNCKTLEDVEKIFYEQLNKCGVDYFDFYLCHAMNLERYNIYKELNAFDFLLKMKKEGKIRNLGFSYHDAAQNIIPIADELAWDFAQIQFNYLDYEMQDAKKQYEELTKRDISVVVMEPVRGGMLANVNKEAEDTLKAVRADKSIASWALRYVADFPNIKVILSGMSNMNQLADNINTFTNYEPLTAEDKLAIDKARKLILGSDFIPCTGCRYCMPCKFGVNIPSLFAKFNNYGIHKNLEMFKKQVSSMDEISLPKNCRKCRVCMQQCPQGIDIPKELEKINKLIEEVA